MLLVFVAWVPVILWQTSPDWAPGIFGAERYRAVMATHVVQVIAVVSAAGMFLAGMWLILGPVFGMLKNISDRAHLSATGLPGRAKVLSLGESSEGIVTINDQPLLALTLEVEDAFGSPYVVAFETVVPRYAVPQVQPGATVPVKIDPNDRRRVAVDWGALGFS
jgi:hypothetical protein